MSRRETLHRAARWALQDGEDGAFTRVPQGAAAVMETLDDPALGEALREAAQFGRLSDDDVRAMRANRRGALTAGASALLLVMVGMTGWQQGWLPLGTVQTAHFETRRGERLDVTLADGSTVTLNGATSLDVRLEGARRLVEMRGGQAHFDIAHDAARPFTVHAGEAGVRVLGTAFDVDMGRHEVRLAVYRGKVRFGGYARAGGVDVPAGWRSQYAKGGPASAPTRFDAGQQDWRQDWINTDAMALGDLVDALNRRGGPMIDEPPRALAQIALSGRFKLNDPHNLLSAIGAAYGFSVRREGESLRLLPDGASGD